MAEFVPVAKVGDIAPGSGQTIPVNGRLVALFHIDGEYLAINDACPHMGASLAEGYVEGDVVACPWHAWRFCVRDGSWVDNPGSKLKTDTFPVRVENDDILVQIPDPPERTATEDPAS